MSLSGNWLMALAMTASTFGKGFEKSRKQLMKVIDEISNTVQKWTDILMNDDENRIIGQTNVDNELKSDTWNLEEILDRASESISEDDLDTSEDDDRSSLCENARLDVCPDSETKNLSGSDEKKEETIKEKDPVGISTAPEQKEIKILSHKEIKLELDFDTKNFYSNFLKPGQCITRLFRDIDKDPFFTSQINERNETATIFQNLIFHNWNNKNEIDNACYTYNISIENLAEKLEISVQGKNEGWVFMMSSYKDASLSLQKILYREFIVKKEQGTWKVEQGQHGEIELPNDNSEFSIEMNNEDGIEKNKPSQWFDTHLKLPCTNNSCRNGTKQKSLSLYWKSKGSSKDSLSKLLKAGAKNKINRQIKNEIEHKSKNVYIKQGAKEGWWKSSELKKYKSLIKTDDKSLDDIKGEWGNLYKFCDTYYLIDKPKEYDAYCYE